MSKKRQSPIFNPQGRPSCQLTTFSYDFADGYFVDEHFHHEDQLVFASRGVMTIRTRHGIWVVPPLRAVWIPGEEVHSIAMSGAVLMRTLYFAPKIATSMSRKCFVMNVSALFRELILHACTKVGWKKRIAEDQRIIDVILDQLRFATAIPLQLPRPKDSRALHVVDLLVNDPSDQRTLKDLCKEAGGSKRTVERAFLEDTGMTFGKWRQQIRLFHGMRLLASGEKVAVAALESGYSSQSAFISVFKKALGAPPNQFLVRSIF